MLGRPATRNDFVRWGHPVWWCYVTGGLEMVSAVLIALPVTVNAGLIISALIVAAAVFTVGRHRDFSHLAPLSLFSAILVLANMT
ncbi:DoxX family protein [Rhizobium leguminosarum]|uniref:DoxX family protein n=1 Tax=Rhizobium leguminosarum TaxID=384 RepID=UPI002F95F9AE